MHWFLYSEQRKLWDKKKNQNVDALEHIPIGILGKINFSLFFRVKITILVLEELDEQSITGPFS